MKLIKYTIDIHPDLHEEPEAKTFEADVASILGDKNGWTKYGYVFQRVNNKAEHILNIELSSVPRIIKKCSFEGKLSCYTPGQHNIYINFSNWMGKSDSSLPIDRYRIYVINHEVGHALGLDHAKCRGAGLTGSVMMQMSKGPDHVAPCLENEYPLDKEVYDEMQNMSEYLDAQNKKREKMFGAGEGDGEKYKINVRLMMVVIIVVILIAMVYIIIPAYRKRNVSMMTNWNNIGVAPMSNN